ncbi:monocarboxylate permease homolog [Scheffersomyces stipitis CBS 6054]|uniref:Monocarboxylate permease homolog n=1 Tax=Scheffersomyces stipitis (strain ATCC 58785 / CBS 6054 / NBRC 10063 / NRRL Y-11545) TaxID=322104 RepID=A3LQJ6_PICST|nr:monocarboxylate permease homolog [Scheffersomyces stipitis CBS 6054]ABN65215.2 monocarboxylate permease homolog [Scheffersomyces stipitis CBS 6054]
MSCIEERIELEEIVEIELETINSGSSSTSILPDSGEIVYPDGGWRAYGVVLGSFLGLTVSFGLINSVGAIQAYIATHQLVNEATSTISWIFSIYLTIAFGVGILVGPVFDTNGALPLLLCGLVLQFVGLMATAVCKSVVEFVFAFSVCVGVGNAFCITPLIGSVSHWFLCKRGQAIGLATVGGSIGGVVIPLMLHALYRNVGFVWAIRVLAFFCLGCQALSVLLVKERVRRKLANSDDNQRKLQQIVHACNELIDLSSLKDMKFVFLTLGVFFEEVSLMCTSTYLSTYAITQGASESTAYILVTVFNASGIVGRVVPAYAADYIGYFNVNALMLTGMVLTMFVMWFPFGSHIGVLYAFSILCGFFVSSVLSITPACLGAITPVHNFGQRYGMCFCLASLGYLIGIPVGAAIIGDGSRHRYDIFALYCSLLALASMLCWMVSRYYIVGSKINVRI